VSIANLPNPNAWTTLAPIPPTISLEGRADRSARAAERRDRARREVPAPPGGQPGFNEPDEPEEPPIDVTPEPPEGRPGVGDIPLPDPPEPPDIVPEVTVTGHAGLMLASVSIPWSQFLIPTITVKGARPRRKPLPKPKRRPRRTKPAPRRPFRPRPAPRPLLPVLLPIFRALPFLIPLLIPGDTPQKVPKDVPPPPDRPVRPGPRAIPLDPVTVSVDRLPFDAAGMPEVVVSAPRFGGRPSTAPRGAPRSLLPDPRLRGVPRPYLGAGLIKPQPSPRPSPRRKPQPRIGVGIAPLTPSPIFASEPLNVPDLRATPLRPNPDVSFPSPGPQPITSPVPSPGNLTALQPLALPSAQTGCKCPPKTRKPRKPRTVCYRGTYTESATGLTKLRKEEIPCR